MIFDKTFIYLFPASSRVSCESFLLFLFFCAKQNLQFLPLEPTIQKQKTFFPRRKVILTTFFTSVFYSKTSHSLNAQHLEVDGEWNDSPTIHEEIVNDPLHHLDTNKSMGLDGIHSRMLRELVEVFTRILSIIC